MGFLMEKKKLTNAQRGNYARINSYIAQLLLRSTESSTQQTNEAITLIDRLTEWRTMTPSWYGQEQNAWLQWLAVFYLGVFYVPVISIIIWSAVYVKSSTIAINGACHCFCQNSSGWRAPSVFSRTYHVKGLLNWIYSFSISDHIPLPTNIDLIDTKICPNACLFSSLTPHFKRKPFASLTLS